MKNWIGGLIVMSITSGFSQNGWVLQNPLPTTEDLRDVYLIDSMKGWAVGNYGTILKTTDGGDNWALQYSNNTLSINSLHFIDFEIGFTVGSIIQKTTNGGLNWIDNLISPKYLWSVQFVGNDTGWVVGENGFILKTTNQGETWDTLNSETTEALISLYFVNSKIGWAAGRNGKIIKTTNGGLNWFSQTSNISSWLRSIYFKDELNGWMVGYSGILLKTTDGGNTWIKKQSGVTSELWNILFTDSENGWVVGTGGKVLKSTDRGETWSSIDLGTTKNLYTVFFKNSNNGWIVGSTGTIYSTKNSGINWLRKNIGNSDQDFRDVFFIDDQNGWIVGINFVDYNGVIIKTTNGGTSWNLQNSVTTDWLNSIFFVNNQVGWAVGSPGIILKTTNGGTEWIKQPSGTQNELNSVIFINDQLGWIAADRETVLRTTNGGLTWGLYSYGYYDNFKAIDFINPNVGWVCGDNSWNYQHHILKTTNGGISWNLQWSGNYNESLGDIFFVDENIGWAVGSYGKVYRTTNGGNTWITQVISTSHNTSIHFVDTQTGWLTGIGFIEGNGIYKTTNGGINWSYQRTGVSQWLNSIFFINNQIGWAVGGGGVILKTTDGGGNFIPVELTFFRGELKNNQVNLNWVTSTETNNKGFEIERKFSDSIFSFIGFVAGNGTTTETHLYSFEDINLSPGSYKYRLKQIDFDGNFSYSNEIEVEINPPFKFQLSQNYPNPFNPSTKIRYAIPLLRGDERGGFATLKVYDILGNEVATVVNDYKPAGNYEVEFSIGQTFSLSSGVYYYQLKVGDFIATKKMLLLK